MKPIIVGNLRVIYRNGNDLWYVLSGTYIVRKFSNRAEAIAFAKSYK